MAVLRRRPRLLLVCALFLYVLAGFSVSDVQSLQLRAPDPDVCPAALLSARRDGARDRSFTVLQGNAWMLPARPLLLPYAFSTDRGRRLERLVEVIRNCRPDVVVLQEVFERPMVRLLSAHLPDYRALTSGVTDLTRTVNVSGLVTLTRLPVGNVRFREFRPLPGNAKTIERLGRKGLLAVDVAGRGFQASVVNTHLYAPRNAGEEGLTRGQFGEVVAFVRDSLTPGRPVLLAGDLNLEPRQIAPLLPRGWGVSEHAATYDPAGNPYTVEGSNNTAGNHRDREQGRGVKTVDLLVAPDPGRTKVASAVLRSPALSDHYFLQHRVVLERE